MINPINMLDPTNANISSSTSTRLFEPRDYRRFLSIVNLDLTNGVFIGFGTPALKNKGIYLKPDGGALLLDNKAVTDYVELIGGAGTPLVAGQEGV